MAPTVSALITCWTSVAIPGGLLEQLELAALYCVEKDERLLQLAARLEGHMADEAVEVALGDGRHDGVAFRRSSRGLHAVDDDLGFHVAIRRIRAGIFLEGRLVGLGEILQLRRAVVG